MTTENPDAVALLADAMEALGWGMGRADWQESDARSLLAHPRLARVVALGLAWVRAEEALPEGWRMALQASSPADVDLPPYRAMAQEFDNFGSKVVNGFAPTPEAALIALAEKIGGSK